MSELESKISGVQRTALFLMAIGEKAAAEVLKRMEPKRFKEISSAMKELNQMDKESVGAVLADFLSASEKVAPVDMDSGGNYFYDVMIKALGKEKTFGLMDSQDLMKVHFKSLESLKWLDPKPLADMLCLEHPQVTANILAFLDSEQAAKVIKFFPQTAHCDILMRIASLDGIKPQVLKDLNSFFEKMPDGLVSSKSSEIGGVGSAANILNFLGTSVDSSVIDEIKGLDADLGAKIEDGMFVFENIMDIEDQGLRALLAEIPPETLVLALKGAGEKQKDKVMSNLSKRAGESIQEELENTGKVRLRDVEVAQKEILTVVRRMADSGELIIGGGGDDEYI